MLGGIHDTAIVPGIMVLVKASVWVTAPAAVVQFRRRSRLPDDASGSRKVPTAAVLVPTTRAWSRIPRKATVGVVLLIRTGIRENKMFSNGISFFRSDRWLNWAKLHAGNKVKVKMPQAGLELSIHFPGILSMPYTMYMLQWASQVKTPSHFKQSRKTMRI